MSEVPVVVEEEVASKEPGSLDERVVSVNRTAKVVKGGRRFGFSAVVVVGDRSGNVGYGFGKAREVVDAIRKAGDSARKSFHHVVMKGRTIPHEVYADFDGSKIVLRPAVPGTGLIASGSMRAVLELAGIHDVTGKSLGSNNKLNVVKATMAALQKLRSAEEIMAMRRA